MAFYTVYLPPVDPLKAPADQLGEARFIKDGFSLFPFIFTGLWLLAQRLWLAFLVFAVIWAALGFGGRALGVNPAALGVAQLLIGAWLGLEGHALLEHKLAREGWRFAGVVEGKDLDMVERRFFEMAGTGGLPLPSAPLVPREAQGASLPVLGLFPDARGR
jgi:uncharacterized membrane protein YtjA (UPF0391 family)